MKNCTINEQPVSKCYSAQFVQELNQFILNNRSGYELSEDEFTEQSIELWYNDAARTGSLTLKAEDQTTDISARNDQGPCKPKDLVAYFKTLPQHQRFVLKNVFAIWNQGILKPLYVILQQYGAFVPSASGDFSTPFKAVASLSEEKENTCVRLSLHITNVYFSVQRNGEDMMSFPLLEQLRKSEAEGTPLAQLRPLYEPYEVQQTFTYLIAPQTASEQARIVECNMTLQPNFSSDPSQGKKIINSITTLLRAEQHQSVHPPYQSSPATQLYWTLFKFSELDTAIAHFDTLMPHQPITPEERLLLQQNTTLQFFSDHYEQQLLQVKEIIAALKLGDREGWHKLMQPKNNLDSTSSHSAESPGLKF